MSGKPYEFYTHQYARFGSDIAAEIRREAFGEDLGQTGWRTLEEQARIASLVREHAAAEVLDIACGTGGPSIALVQLAGCRLTGVDIEPLAIDQAKRLAEACGLTGRARFESADCNKPLPFAVESFDVILCMDAILHLDDRMAALTDWARLLRRGGRLIFADAAVLTGPMSREEIAIRASQGPFVVVPPGANEAAIAAAGLVLQCKDDTTASMAGIAGGLKAARLHRASLLIETEGTDWFTARQRFLETTSKLASSGRLSRLFYIAKKPLR